MAVVTHLPAAGRTGNAMNRAASGSCRSGRSHGVAAATGRAVLGAPAVSVQTQATKVGNVGDDKALPNGNAAPGRGSDALSKLIDAPSEFLQNGRGARGRGAAGRYPPPAQQLDFDDEARKLWARLNLDPSVVSGGAYNALDALWRHPETGAIFFVGNQTAAASLPLLQQHRVTHVVNCTDSMPLYHDRPDGPIKYLRFDITSHYRLVKTDQEAVAFVQPMLDFVGNALARGHNVMVHCLAGAHRAGTTGVICLMHFAGLSGKEAVPVAKRLRPIIDPIGAFPELIAKLDRGWKGRAPTK